MRAARLVLAFALLGFGRAAASPAPPRLKHRFFVAPDEIRSLDARTLAELLVDRIRRECDAAGAPGSGEKVLGDDAALILMIPAAALESISRDGFLNQHQTLTSGGFHRERDRFEAEQELAMLRLPFSVKGRGLLPKYAVLDVPSGDLGRFRLPGRYGGVAAVFKKRTSLRATWTYADSLDYSQKAGRFGAGGAGNPVLARTFAYERKKEDRNRCGNYCEAQIWGDLSLRDVAYMMVPDSEPVPAAAARAGIPVYGYTLTDGAYTRGARRGADSSPRSAPGGESGEAEANFRRELGVARLSDAELAAAADSASDAEDGAGGFSPRQRLIGELAARPKSPAVVRGLERAFASVDVQTRALALYGLSELPWEAFKPRLLDGLGAAPGPLLISAIAFAADHQGDADVSARLDLLRRAPASPASEWVERLGRASLCSPR